MTTGTTKLGLDLSVFLDPPNQSLSSVESNKLLEIVNDVFVVLSVRKHQYRDFKHA